MSVFAVLMNTQQCWLAVLRLIRTLAVCKAKLVFFSGLEVREKSGGFAFGELDENLLESLAFLILKSTKHFVYPLRFDCFAGCFFAEEYRICEKCYFSAIYSIEFRI